MPTNNRIIRKTAILAKIETTYGTDSAPVGATDAVLASNMVLNPLNSRNVDRALIRPYFGASEMLIGPASVEASLDVELVGSGAIGTAAPWFPLARACGLAQTVTAATRADITPVSDAIDSMSIHYHDDGLRKKLLGAVGEATFSFRAGEVAKLALKLIGLDGGDAAVANPTATLTAWKQPQVIYAATSQTISVGCTHSPTGAPALVGGTAYPSMGLEFSLGNELSFNPFLGSEAVDIVNRVVTGKATFNLTAAQEVTFMTAIKAGTLQSVGMVAGNVANSRVMVYLPAVQWLNPTKSDAGGVRTFTVDFRATPVSGNDEFRIVTSY